MLKRLAFEMRFRRWTLLALAVMTASFSTLTRAQDKKPVVVAAFHSYQKFLDHLEIIAKFSGLEKFNTQFSETIAKMTQAEGLKVTDLAGVDKTRPMGLFVLPGDAAEVVLFLPVTDFSAALSAVQPLTGEASEAGDGLRTLTLMNQTAFIKEHSGWALLSPQRESLANPPADPGALVGDMLKSHEAALRLNLTDLSAEQRSSLADTVQGLLGAGLAQQSGETDPQFTLRKTVMEQQLDMLRTLLSDTEQADIGMRLDPETGTSIGDLSLKAASGSVSAAHMAAFGAKPSRVGGMLGEQDALALHVNLGLDESQIKKFQGQMDAYRGAVGEAIANAADAGEPEHRQALQGLVDRLFDGMKSSIAGGQLNLAVRCKSKNLPLTLVIGMATEPSAGLDATIREFGALAKGDPGFTKVELDVAKQGDVAIHGFEMQKEKPVPGAKPGQGSALEKIFKTRQFYVAAAGDRAYVAFGPKGLDEIKEALDAKSSEVAPISVSTNTSLLANLAGIMNAGQPTAMAFSLISMNLSFGAEQPLNDRLTMTMKPAEGGLTGHMEMGNGLLRVIAVILPLVAQLAGGGGGGLF